MDNGISSCLFACFRGGPAKSQAFSPQYLSLAVLMRGTACDNHWGEKACVWGYRFPTSYKLWSWRQWNPYGEVAHS